MLISNRHLRTAIFGLLGAIALVGCATTDRLPAVPLSLAAQTSPLSIQDARYYPDSDSVRLEALGRKAFEREKQHLGTKGATGKLPPARFLAISGGGDDGAFGAGLLCGWSARGDRPEFRLVTGISTGALSAPFAFLGPEYDRHLKQVYTNTDPSDIFAQRGLLIAAVAADAMTDSAPLRNMISQFVDEKMVARIAEEYGKGRLLLIMTTNLDQGRPVIWNIGAIAESRHPKARELIVSILLASASIPGLFPPVMLDITHEGKLYQEMHVDGGATAQAFLYPPTHNLGQLAQRGAAHRQRIAYVIRNGRLFRAEAEVKRRTLSVAAQAASAMIAANGINDTYRIYMTTKRDGVEYNLAYIDAGFSEPYKGPFDRQYMNKLFNYGYERGRAGYHWHKSPPGYLNKE